MKRMGLRSHPVLSPKGVRRTLRPPRSIVWLVAATGLAACTAAKPLALPSSTSDAATQSANEKEMLRAPLGATGTLRLARVDGIVHLSLEDGADGIASVFLFDGERVYVLHASAALGTAIFARTATGGWDRVQGFAFDARDPNDRAARDAFWKEQGWLANVTPPERGAPPAGDRRFLIDLRHFEHGAPLRIAAGYLHLRPGALTVDPWPARLSDDVSDVGLHEGHTDRTPIFTPEQWATVIP